MQSHSWNFPIVQRHPGDAKRVTKILWKGTKIRKLGGDKVYLSVSGENKRIKPIK